MKFEIKIYSSDYELIDVQILSDKRYDSLSHYKSLALVLSFCNETIPKDCHYKIKKLKR